MSNQRSIPDRKRVVSTEDRPHRGHRLVEIAERLPGREPTDGTSPLTDGPTYRTRYWRCRECGQEHNSRSAFDAPCPSKSTPVSPTDGGYSIEDPRTQQALSPELRVEPGDQPGVFVVESTDRPTHRVDLRAESCTCADSQDGQSFCVHLRRADIEHRSGLVPRPHRRSAD